MSLNYVIRGFTQFSSLFMLYLINKQGQGIQNHTRLDNLEVILKA